MKEKLKTIAVRSLMVAVSLTITLVLLEVCVRIFMPQQLIIRRSNVYVPDDRFGHRVAANIDTHVNTGERKVHVLTDAHGHRVGAEPRTAAEYRILALGDSFLLALQVEYAQIMTTLLEAPLSEALGGQVEVVNTGVEDWNPNHYLLEEKDELARTDYDMVLVFIYMENDVVSYRVDEFAPRESEPVHRLRIPKALSKDELVNALLYPINDYFEGHSHLFVWVKSRLLATIHSEFVSHSFADAMLSDFADDHMWANTADICADIEAEAARYDIPTLFVLLPAPYQIYADEWLADYLKFAEVDPNTVDLDQPARLLLSEMRARGLTVIDITDALLDVAEADGVRLYGDVDRHFTPHGHAVVADLLVEPVLEQLRAEPQ